MSALRWGLIIFGILVLLAGVTFALQGAYGIGGGSVMDNSPPWIYIGTAIAIIGGGMVAAAYWRGPRK